MVFTMPKTHAGSRKLPATYRSMPNLHTNAVARRPILWVARHSSSKTSHSSFRMLRMRWTCQCARFLLLSKAASIAATPDRSGAAMDTTRTFAQTARRSYACARVTFPTHRPRHPLLPVRSMRALVRGNEDSWKTNSNYTPNRIFLTPPITGVG